MTESKKSNWFGNEDQKGNFSNDRRDTFDPEKRYIGIRLQQGVPLLDRDWNELEDIRRNEERMLRKWYIGDGVPGDDGFKILALEKEKQGDDFKIKNGRCMVDGFLVINKTDEGFILYSAQTEGEPDAEKISELTEFFVYLDVWIEEVNGEADPALKNKNDVNMETCVRHQLKWRVRVRSGDLASKAQVHHHYYDLASVERGQTGSIEETNISDLRRTGLSLSRLREGLFVDKSGKVGIGTTTPADKLDVNGAIRFNGISDRRIYGDARGASGPQGAGSAVVLKGRWDELEVKGRVIDWTGSDLHIGHDQNHENHMVYIAKHCKLRGVEINAPLYVTKDLHVSEGLQIMNKPQDANGDTLILGDSVGMVTQGSNIIRYTSHLRLGYHQDYSWIQSYGSKPLAINPLGEKVGIGTTDPKAKLDVSGDIRAGTLSVASGTFGAHTYIPYTDGTIYLTGDLTKSGKDDKNWVGGLIFRNNDGKSNINRFVIEGKTGNATLNHACLVGAKSGDVVGLNLRSPDGGGVIGYNIDHSIFFVKGRDGGSESVCDYYEVGSHRFFTDGKIENQKERMRIAQNGNIGIGTNAPQAKLDVRGDICLGPPNVGNGGKLLLTYSQDFHYIQANNYWTEFVSHPNEGWKFISNFGTTKNEVVRISGSGNMGIGTDPGSFRLSIGDTDGQSVLHIASDFDFSNKDKLNLIRFGSVGDYQILHRSKGQLGHNTLALHCDNNCAIGIYSSGWTALFEVEGRTGDYYFKGKNIGTSDLRLKTNVMQLTNVLSKVERIRGVSFEWNELYDATFGGSTGQREIGLIAQEVEEVFPELVKTLGKEKYLGINYEKIVVLLVEAIKELKAKVDVLERKV